MQAVKKRVLSVEGLYFNYTNRLTTIERLLSCDALPTMILPSPTNTDLTFGGLGVNSAGPLNPPPPQAQIAQYKGVSTSVSGGVLPTDSTAAASVLPDGTIGTVYQFSFKATTDALIDGLNRVIDEQYQLWVSNDDYPAYWTSHWELSRRFGDSNVLQWADPDNLGITSDILSNIWGAVAEATCEFQARLRGSPCGIITQDVASRAFELRRHVTSLAAYILYTARGVKDTSDEEGRNRLTSVYKSSQKFLQQCRAGQIRLVDGDVGVTTHPFVGNVSMPFLSPFGPARTPEEMLRLNQISEMSGIPSYNVWFHCFDALTPLDGISLP